MLIVYSINLIFVFRALQQAFWHQHFMRIELWVFVFKSVINHDSVGDVCGSILHFRLSLMILRVGGGRVHLLLMLFICLSPEGKSPFELRMLLLCIR